MSKSFIRGGVCLVILSVAGFGGWIVSLPAATAEVEAPPVPQAEADGMLAALRPAGRERPLVTVIGINDATETTDYLMPTGILRRAGVADVTLLATGPGPVQIYPALKVEPDATIAEFDADHPEGADYVVVPQMEPHDDPAALAWIRSQSDKGAIVIGVCGGATVVGAAGLLDGKRATTHWYYRGRLRDESPTARYVADRRLVVDGTVATTTGITASMPMMLALTEAIAGRAKAKAVARDLGVTDWDAAMPATRSASTARSPRRYWATCSLSGTGKSSASASSRAWTRCRLRWWPMPGRAPTARLPRPMPPRRARWRAGTAFASSPTGQA